MNQKVFKLLLLLVLLLLMLFNLRHIHVYQLHTYDVQCIHKPKFIAVDHNYRIGIRTV